MSLMFEVGCRPGEVISLLRGDVHLDSDDPHLIIRQGKTASAARRVPLTTTAIEVLRRRMAVTTGKCLFPGRTPDESILVLDRTAHRNGCTRARVGYFTPYTARHTAATRLAQSGCVAG